MLNEALLDEVAGHPQAKLLHGVGQPVGGAVDDPIEYRPLLRRCVEQLDPAWVSEHLSFNRIRGADGPEETGFLLPPRQVVSGVRVAADDVRAYGRTLGRPVAFETGVNYLQPRADEMTDGEFFAAVAGAADCGILLDLLNLWCNESNGRDRVVDVLECLPMDRVWEVHLAGGMPLSGFWLDAHSGEIPGEVIAIAADVLPRLTSLGAIQFEILPEHVPALGIDGVQAQLDVLQRLWDLRPPRVVEVPRRDEATPAATPQAAGTPDVVEVRAWECALTAAVRGEGAADQSHAWVRADPGTAVLRELVGDFRRGALTRTLRYTITALLAGIGRRHTHEVLDSYFAHHAPDSYPAVEADRFAGISARDRRCSPPCPISRRS